MPEAPEPRWLDQGQQRDWRALVIGTTLLFDRLSDELRESFGISLTEYEILVRLSEADGHTLRMAVLADALRHSRSRVTHTIARMERSGLVLRSPCADDGRGIQATMTERGHQLLVAAAPTHVQGVRDNLVDLVSAEDFAALGRVMNAVADRMVSDHPDRDIR